MPTALETYLPHTVTLANQPIADTFALTLHNPDSHDPYGSLTTHHPPSEGTHGALEVVGLRDGQTWRVVADEVEVYRSTAAGCEFTIFGTVRRQRVNETR